MELNDKQLALCLDYALGQFLVGWKGTPQEAWKRLQALCKVAPETDSTEFEDITDVVVCSAYEHTCLSDLIEKIESACFSNQNLVERAILAVKRGV